MFFYFAVLVEEKYSNVNENREENLFSLFALTSQLFALVSSKRVYVAMCIHDHCGMRVKMSITNFALLFVLLPDVIKSFLCSKM